MCSRNTSFGSSLEVFGKLRKSSKNCRKCSECLTFTKYSDNFGNPRKIWSEIFLCSLILYLSEWESEVWQLLTRITQISSFLLKGPRDSVFCAFWSSHRCARISFLDVFANWFTFTFLFLSVKWQAWNNDVKIGLVLSGFIPCRDGGRPLVEAATTTTKLLSK